MTKEKSTILSYNSILCEKGFLKSSLEFISFSYFYTIKKNTGKITTTATTTPNL